MLLFASYQAGGRGRENVQLPLPICTGLSPKYTVARTPKGTVTYSHTAPYRFTQRTLSSPRTVSRQIDGEHLSAPGADNAGKIRPFLLAAALAVDEQPDALRIFAVQYGRDLIDVKKRLLHCRIPSIASRATAMSFKISGRMLSR